MAKAKGRGKPVQKKSKARGPAPRNNGRMASRSNPTFGPVATINTAPVAIGNSMRGVTASIVQTSRDSVRVVGRDFAYTASGTGTATTWVPVGGFPLTPACFVSSALRNYTQMYNKFKFNKCRLHYITSSATSSTGDVMFQVNSNRTDPIANWGAANFLPYALSKPETVIGPQWTNHTMEIMPKGPTRDLVPGQNVDIDYQAQGEIFLFSKTASTDSPGYVLIDYDVTFFEMSINPKTGLLPNPLMIYQPVQLYQSTSAVTAQGASIWQFGTDWVGGTTTVDTTTSAYFKAGDVFKITIDVTNTNIGAYTVSAGTKPTASTLFTQVINANTAVVTLTDGYTMYALVMATGNLRFYPTVTCALTDTQEILAGQTYTPNSYAATAHVPTAGVWLFGSMSWCCTSNTNALQQA